MRAWEGLAQPQACRAGDVSAAPCLQVAAGEQARTARLQQAMPSSACACCERQGDNLGTRGTCLIMTCTVWLQASKACQVLCGCSIRWQDLMLCVQHCMLSTSHSSGKPTTCSSGEMTSNMHFSPRQRHHLSGRVCVCVCVCVCECVCV